MAFNLVPYTDALLPAVVEFWNKAFRSRRNFFPITPEIFCRRVIDKRTGAEEFDPNGFLCAVDGPEVVGVMHVGVRSEPFCLALNPDWKGGKQGYVALMAVDKYMQTKGVGAALWERGMEYCKGTREVVIDGQCINPFYGNSEGPFTPFWGTPEGISVEWGDHRTRSFLQKRGHAHRFKGDQLELNVEAAPACSVVELERDLGSREFQLQTAEASLPMLGESFPQGARPMHGFTFESLMVLHQQRVVGLLTFYPMLDLAPDRAAIYESHVLDSYQGQGIGTALLRIAIETMRGAGMKTCDVLTVPELSPGGLDFYTKAGFKPCQEWAIY